MSIYMYINTTQVVQELWSLGLTLHMYEAEVANGVVWCVFPFTRLSSVHVSTYLQ